ncbi:hypothetical protein [uncultured Mediterranean phage uvMED]|nr:hypothetical protein [uncultured Mediterranean phage uvMED]
MTLLGHRGPFPLTHVKELEGISDSHPENKYYFDSPLKGLITMTHKWSRDRQLTWLGIFRIGEGRLYD